MKTALTERARVLALIEKYRKHEEARGQTKTCQLLVLLADDVRRGEGGVDSTGGKHEKR